MMSRTIIRICLVEMLAILVSGYGGGGNSAPPPPPPAQNYTVTVTATSEALQHSTAITVTVQ